MRKTNDKALRNFAERERAFLEKNKGKTTEAGMQQKTNGASIPLYEEPTKEELREEAEDLIKDLKAVSELSSIDKPIRTFRYSRELMPVNKKRTEDVEQMQQELDLQFEDEEIMAAKEIGILGVGYLSAYENKILKGLAYAWAVQGRDEKVQEFCEEKIGWRPTKKGEAGFVLINATEFANLISGGNKGGNSVKLIEDFFAKSSYETMRLHIGDAVITRTRPLFVMEQKVEAENRVMNKKGSAYIIRLNSEFVEVCRKNYMTMRADYFRLFRDTKTTLCLHLYDLLCRTINEGVITEGEQNRYIDKEGCLVFIKSKPKLKQEITKGYDALTLRKNPGRVEKDFWKAIDKLKEIGIIVSYEETAKITTEHNAVFRLNMHHIEECKNGRRKIELPK